MEEPGHARRCGFVPITVAQKGWDAAGKGGAIEHLTARLDPRSYEVHAIAAPSDDDARRHYLYRFWRRPPVAAAIPIPNWAKEKTKANGIPF